MVVQLDIEGITVSPKGARPPGSKDARYQGCPTIALHFRDSLGYPAGSKFAPIVGGMGVTRGGLDLGVTGQLADHG